jgi:hypothetical protein
VHSHLRRAIMSATRQQGEEETDTGVPHGNWARRLKSVLALALARCRWGQQGALRSRAAITPRCGPQRQDSWGARGVRCGKAV